MGDALNASGISITHAFDVGWNYLSDSIGGWFGDVMDNVGSVLSNMVNGFEDVGNFFGELLSYFDVTSDKFFLKVAFVPSQDYMTAYKDDFNSAIDSKFAFFYQVTDMFDSIKSSVQSNVDHWDGIKVDFTQYHMGELTIIDPKFANLAIPKMKFWIGGLMYFMTAMFIIRKVSNVLGAGK